MLFCRIWSIKYFWSVNSARNVEGWSSAIKQSINCWCPNVGADMSTGEPTHPECICWAERQFFWSLISIPGYFCVYRSNCQVLWQPECKHWNFVLSCTFISWFIGSKSWIIDLLLNVDGSLDRNVFEKDGKVGKYYAGHPKLSKYYTEAPNL